MPTGTSKVQFAQWQYDKVSGELTHVHDLSCRRLLEPRLQQLLNFFLAHPQQLFSKAALLNAVWGELDVAETALQRTIGSLRKALDDKEGTLIVTHPKKGYSWHGVIIQPAAEASLTEQISATAAITSPAESIAAAPQDTKNVLASTHAQPSLEQSCPPAAETRHAPEQSFRWPPFIAALLIVSSLLLLVTLYWQQSPNPPVVFSVLDPLHASSAVTSRGQVNPRGDLLVYVQQGIPFDSLRLLNLRNQKETTLAAGYQQIGRASWLSPTQFVVMTEQDGQCLIQQFSTDGSSKLQPLATCHTFHATSLTQHQSSIWWLDQNEEGNWQLWQLVKQQPQSFPLRLSNPLQLASFADRLWVLSTHSPFASQLTELDPATGAQLQAKVLPRSFESITWLAEDLWLASSSRGLALLKPSRWQMQSFAHRYGWYKDISVLDPNRLLLTFQRDHASSLLALQVQHPRLTRESYSYLQSNRSEYAIAQRGKEIAWVSERTGSPQVWWSDGRQLRQLTQLHEPLQISRLWWVGQQVYGQVDGQLQILDRSTGQFTPSNLPIPQHAWPELCDNQWYWTEYVHDQWRLVTLLATGKIQVLQPDVYTFRCSAAGQLLLQSSKPAPIQVYDLAKQSVIQQLPLVLAPEQALDWTTNRWGVAWLDRAQKTLVTVDWQWQSPKNFPLTEIDRAQGIWASFEEDVLWLDVSGGGQTGLAILRSLQFRP